MPIFFVIPHFNIAHCWHPPKISLFLIGKWFQFTYPHEFHKLIIECKIRNGKLSHWYRCSNTYLTQTFLFYKKVVTELYLCVFEIGWQSDKTLVFCKPSRFYGLINLSFDKLRYRLVDDVVSKILWLSTNRLLLFGLVWDSPIDWHKAVLAVLSFPLCLRVKIPRI